MQYTIRDACSRDRPSIAAFTQDTFTWGDYVSDVFEDWLDDPNGKVVVAADSEDRAVAMVKMTMLSANEAWAHGARVHPDHRRRGLASAMHDVLSPWAARRGAKVCRLFVEEGNTPAERQVEVLGFSVVAHWFYCTLEGIASAPVTEGNGGKRKPRRPLLTAAAKADVPALFISWSDSELYRAGRGLIAQGWTCRRMRDADLEAAAGRKALLEGPPGAAIIDRHDADPDELWLSWVSTDENDSPGLVSELVTVAVERGAAAIRGMLPETPWLRAAFDDAGFDTAREQLYSRPLP